MSRTRKSLFSAAFCAGLFYFLVSLVHRHQTDLVVNGYLRFMLMHLVLTALIIEITVLPIFIVLRRINFTNLFVYLLWGGFLGHQIFAYLHGVENAEFYGTIGGLIGAIAFWRTNTKLAYPHAQP